MQAEQSETQEPEATPTETPEAPEQEPEQEKTEGEEPPAEEKPEPKEGEEGAPPGEKPATEAEKVEAANRGRGGWYRKIERLERANAEKDQIIQRLSQNLGTPAAPEAKPKDASAQAFDAVSAIVKEQLAAERAREQQTRVQAEFQKRMTEVQAAHPDFEEALQDVSHIEVPAELRQTLFTSEQGPAIMYQLAKNPAELARISALPPLDAAREIGRLEARASFTPAPKTQAKSATRPPAPPTSVGGKSSMRNLDDLDIASYKRALRSKGR